MRGRANQCGEGVARGEGVGSAVRWVPALLLSRALDDGAIAALRIGGTGYSD